MKGIDPKVAAAVARQSRPRRRMKEDLRKPTSVGELRAAERTMPSSVPSMDEVAEDYERQGYDAYEAEGDYQMMAEAGGRGASIAGPPTEPGLNNDPSSVVRKDPRWRSHLRQRRTVRQ
jgi:hypothetical protein